LDKNFSGSLKLGQIIGEKSLKIAFKFQSAKAIFWF